MTEIMKHIKSQATVLFVPTNGAGLGHLTRCLGLARRLHRIDPSVEIVFLSTSPAIQLILQEGFMAYYIPPRMLCPEYIGAGEWNQLLYNQLTTVIKLHQPQLMVFDGVFPYASLISATKHSPGLRTVWIQRKKKSSSLTDGKEKLFDHVIVPGEVVPPDRDELSGTYIENPFIYLDPSDLLDQMEVRREWNIPWRSKLVYVQLGAGNINQISHTIKDIVQIFQKRRECFLVLGESIIGKNSFPKTARTMVLREYPNSKYFQAFDLVISACGYNTFHELMYFGVPSILIPNEKTVSDDQVERAAFAHHAGAAIMVRKPSYLLLEEATQQALTGKNNQQMRNAAMNLVKKNGADEAAQMLLSFLNQG